MYICIYKCIVEPLLRGHIDKRPPSLDRPVLISAPS